MMCMLALSPMLALAAPPAGAPPGGQGGAQGAAEEGARLQRMEKRMRLARTIALADALDLDDAAALRARDLMAKFDERRAPLRKQARESRLVLQDAARGDQAASGQVDQALQRWRDAHDKLQKLNAEMLQQLSQGLSPQKKARAVLVLERFHGLARRMGHGGGPCPRGEMHDRGRAPGMGRGQHPGMGMGPWTTPGSSPALSMNDGVEPDFDDFPGEE